MGFNIPDNVAFGLSIVLFCTFYSENEGLDLILSGVPMSVLCGDFILGETIDFDALLLDGEFRGYLADTRLAFSQLIILKTNKKGKI